MSSLRHLYLVPALWAALASGRRQGCLIGGVAGLVQAPLVLPTIESAGLDPGTLDGLVSLLIPLALGGLLGLLRDQSGARAGQLSALLDVQRSLAGSGPLDERLRLVATRIRAALGASRVGLVVSSGKGLPVAVSVPVAAAFDGRSTVSWTLRTGKPVGTRDLGTDCRFACPGPPGPAPVRGLVLPLSSGEVTLGALALEWVGDLPAATRLAAEEMAMHLGLGIENARLTLRQRGFARELEDKVAGATNRLRELDRAKSEFLSVVSHELRTPLTALQGFSELLLTRNVPAERSTRFLTHLHNEARRLSRIVEELLDLSRIEAGQPQPLRHEEVDLNDLVEENVELLAAEHLRHRFRWEPRRGLRVPGDRDALDRVLKNLLSNAVKYSPGGGEVRISGGPVAGRPGLVELVVEDEGVGIAAADLPRVFDKYVRIPNAETAGARGLGLGLSLVQALVEAHGGTIEVESTPGKGSRFRVLLPG